VIVLAEEWARKTVRKGTLEFLLASPLRADLDPELSWSASATRRVT
jgi:hypothetical protein